jgi:GNAT superfamily N-acetyltransferase
MIQYGKEITPEEYLELRRKVGWCLFPAEEAKAGIDNAHSVICARDAEKAVGVVRLLWDGGYIAMLADVIVDPDYQGQGIGRSLVEQIIQRMKDDMKPGYKVKLNLMAAKGKEPFYEKFGFVVRPNENLGAGMDQWFEVEA